MFLFCEPSFRHAGVYISHVPAEKTGFVQLLQIGRKSLVLRCVHDLILALCIFDKPSSVVKRTAQFESCRLQ